MSRFAAPEGKHSGGCCSLSPLFSERMLMSVSLVTSVMRSSSSSNRLAVSLSVVLLVSSLLDRGSSFRGRCIGRRDLTKMTDQGGERVRKVCRDQKYKKRSQRY
jgi:hypothetical protein